jgi:hypothetical protein
MRILRVVTLTALVGAVVAAPSANAAPSAGANVSPLCSLYAVTLTTEVLLKEFNSPKLTTNAKKWPLLMAQAKNARLAFARPPLLAVRSRYDSLVDRLRVVGERLVAGDRGAAYAELKAAAPDLAAVLAVARRARLACRSGTTVFYIR